MKTQLLMAVAGGTALLTYLVIKKYSTADRNPTFERKVKHTQHHLTNVFANAKKYGDTYTDADIL